MSACALSITSRKLATMSQRSASAGDRLAGSRRNSAAASKRPRARSSFRAVVMGEPLGWFGFGDFGGLCLGPLLGFRPASPRYLEARRGAGWLRALGKDGAHSPPGHALGSQQFVERPTLEQIRHVIQTMPASTEIERRDRALIALTILTGARDGAIASLKLKHIDIDQGRVDQDAREVKTKFLKSFATWFFPVGKDIRQIVVDWVTYLRQDKLWGLDDPLFPATKIVVGDSRHFEASGLDRKHWSSAGPIRAIFKDAFAAAGLSYFNPHSFRKTLALLGGQICKSPEEYKAWSQNLGHENVLTTFSSYGDVARHRQAEIIRSLGKSEQHACISSSSLIVLPAKGIFDGATS